jgi:hypothetical protein
MAEKTKKKKEKATALKDIEPKLREKKELPGVGELLTYGSNYGKERTWLDIFSGPIIIIVLFLLSMQLFLYIRPHLGKNELPRVHSHIPDMLQQQQHTAPDEEPPLKPVEVKREEPSGEF